MTPLQKTYERMQAMCHVLDYAWLLPPSGVREPGKDYMKVEVSKKDTPSDFGTIKIFPDGSCQLAYAVNPGHPAEVLCALLNIANR